MVRNDIRLYLDCIGMVKRIGMIPTKINRKKELKDYDTLLEKQIKEKEKEILKYNTSLFSLMNN